MDFICARENIYERNDLTNTIKFLTEYFNDAKPLINPWDINFKANDYALNIIKETDDDLYYYILADFIVNNLNESLHYLRGRAFEEILNKYNAKFEKGVRWILMNINDKREKLT